jgi:hypothetical protein
MSSPVMQALHNQRLQEASAWGRWCILKKIRALPASPTHVAAFVKDCEPLMQLDEIWAAVHEISRSHIENNLADPTSGGAAAQAINSIARLEAPRSWPRLMKERFADLPYDFQSFIAMHEPRREKELRRSQNEAGDARRKLIALQNTIQGKSDVDSKSQTASA